MEFDNIKVFYHPTSPNDVLSLADTWSFYIARPGASARDCINWEEENIKIEAQMPNAEWGECKVLIATPGSRVRISYIFKSEMRTCDIVFPEHNPATRTLHLK